MAEVESIVLRYLPGDQAGKRKAGREYTVVLSRGARIVYRF